MQPALLLNASFEPLKVISWRRSVILLLSGKVEIVEAYEEEVHTVSFAIRLPSVLRLTRYIKTNKHMHTIRFSRTNIFIRDSFSCQYCGDKGTPTRAGMKLIRMPLEPAWNSFYIFTIFLKNSPDSWKAYVMPYATS